MRILMLQVKDRFIYNAYLLKIGRGLDNAGKTTIVKKIMNEDVHTVSPTLGFNIRTIDHDGYVDSAVEEGFAEATLTQKGSYKLNICMTL